MDGARSTCGGEEERIEDVSGKPEAKRQLENRDVEGRIL
jgi:hypothetical protein